MKAFFLTAGYATRFQPQSLHTPKPLMPFWGAPLICYTYEWMKDFSPTACIFNLHHLKKQTKEGILELFQDTNLIFTLEEPNILGSGGALLNAKKYLDEDFFIINADEAFFPKNQDYLSAFEEHKRENRLATFFTINHEEAGKKFGAIWVNDNEDVLSVGKNPPSDKAHAKHYIGAAILSPKLLEGKEPRNCHLFQDIVLEKLGEGPIKTKSLSADWFELGNPSDFLKAHKNMAKNWDYFSKHPLFETVRKKYVKPYEVQRHDNGFLVNQGGSLQKSFSGFCWLGDQIQLNTMKDSLCYSQPESPDAKDLILF